MRNQAYCVFFSAIFLISLACIGDVIHYLTGDPDDVEPALKGPGLLLSGGGGDVDEGYQWMIDTARGCSGCDTGVDVVVLRASGADGYNDYLQMMNGVDSVESLVLTDRDNANNPGVASKVRKAEVLFMAGGDQCNYVRFWRGTKVETAIESVYDRAGSIGGNSAGLAILGQYSFDACVDTIYSKEALADPYGPKVSLTTDFFRWKYLEKTITDSHFQQRDRMGRLLTFLARLIQDGHESSILGIGINEKTALTLSPEGQATVIGDGPVYFILADHKPEFCEPGKPLTYNNYKIWKKNKGEKFDLKNRPTSGYYLRSVVDGVITENPY